MLYKSFIILFLSFFFTNSINAQQDLCPDYEWVEGIKIGARDKYTGIYHYGFGGNYKYLKDEDNNHILAIFSAGGNILYNDSITIAHKNFNYSYPLKLYEFGQRLVVLKLDKDFKLLWHNSLVFSQDSMTNQGDLSLTGLALDSKGNIYITGEAKSNPAESKLQIDNKVIYLTTRLNPISNIRQDGFMFKLNRTNGSAFWLKKLSGIRPFDLQISPNDSLYLPFVTYRDTLGFDNTLINRSDSGGLAKFDALGELRWIAWGKGKYIDVIHAVLGAGIISDLQQRHVFSFDNQDNVYIRGLIDDTTIAKINTNGQIEWQRKYPNYKNVNSNHSAVSNIQVSNNGNVYAVIGLNSTSFNVSNPHDFGNGNMVQLQQLFTYYLWEMNVNNGQTTSAAKLWQHTNDSTSFHPVSLTADSMGYLYISGIMSGKDSVMLGDSVFHITQYYANNNTPQSGLSQDAFVSKVQAPAEGMGDVKFIWSVRTEGKGAESIMLAQSSTNGQEHYFYGGLSGGDGKLGKYHFTDTFGSGITKNEVALFFGKINTDCSLPTEEITNPLQSVNIYPNPAHSQITITNLPLNSTINITDISGRVLYTAYNKQNSTAQIPLNGISNGMYFVQIINGENKENRKVVVQW